MKNTILVELIEQDYGRATVFENMGVDYEKYLDKPLATFCEEIGANLAETETALKAVKCQSIPFDLSMLDIPVLIAYLKNTHHDYAKRKIPHIGKNLERLESRGFPVTPLKKAFRNFSKDLGKHMLLEENLIFPFINNLYLLLKEFDAVAATRLLASNSSEFLCASHTEEDDEMKELRELTGNYGFTRADQLFYRILLYDLQSLEKDLLAHSKLEDEVLFKKAAAAEKQLRTRLELFIRTN